MAKFIELPEDEGKRRLLNTEHISSVDFGCFEDSQNYFVDIKMPMVDHTEYVWFGSESEMMNFLEKNFIFFNK